MEEKYVVNAADLVELADTIREKGETTEQLMFPDGFVTAIHDIKCGAGLNFEVVGGTIQPINPKENTIWVNTSNTITSYVFASQTPSNPTEGMVWFSIGAKSPLYMSLLTDNSIIPGLIGTSQYISGSWVSKSTLCYVNGKWTSYKLYLIENAKINKDVTDWTPKAATLTGSGNATALSVSYGTDYITLSQTGNYNTGMFHTTQKIDLTPFSSLRFVGYPSTNVTSDFWVCLRVYSSIGSDSNNNSLAKLSLHGINAVCERTIDITNINQACNIGFHIYGEYNNYIRIKNLILE